jgi:peptidoglycan/LPS O-acetylase OafA/YrhL
VLGAASWYVVERPAQRLGHARRALASGASGPSGAAAPPARPAYEPR